MLYQREGFTRVFVKCGRSSEGQANRVRGGVVARINLVEAAHGWNKQLVADIIERSDQFVEGVIDRMEERLRCSAELDRVDDEDIRNAKERKKLS
jgi:hypothetical protein